MKNFIKKLLLVLLSFYPVLSYAADISITSNQVGQQSFTSDNQTITISGDGNVVFNTDDYLGINDYEAAPISSNYYSNSSIIIDTNLSTNGVTATGSRAGAIAVLGGNLNELTIDSGTVTSSNASAYSVYIANSDNLFSTVNIGQSSGNSGTISNTGDGGVALLFAIGGGGGITINNNATGTISATDNASSVAISVFGASTSTSLTLNNAGIINAGSGKALDLRGSDSVINNSGTITGDISI